MSKALSRKQYGVLILALNFKPETGEGGGFFFFLNERCVQGFMKTEVLFSDYPYGLSLYFHGANNLFLLFVEVNRNINPFVTGNLSRAPFTRVRTNFCTDEFCTWTACLHGTVQILLQIAVVFTWVRANFETSCVSAMIG